MVLKSKALDLDVSSSRAPHFYAKRHDKLTFQTLLIPSNNKTQCTALKKKFIENHEYFPSLPL